MYLEIDSVLLFGPRSNPFCSNICISLLFGNFHSVLTSLSDSKKELLEYNLCFCQGVDLVARFLPLDKNHMVELNYALFVDLDVVLVVCFVRG